MTSRGSYATPSAQASCQQTPDAAARGVSAKLRVLSVRSAGAPAFRFKPLRSFPTPILRYFSRSSQEIRLIRITACVVYSYR